MLTIRHLTLYVLREGKRTNITFLRKTYLIKFFEGRYRHFKYFLWDRKVVSYINYSFLNHLRSSAKILRSSPPPPTSLTYELIRTSNNISFSEEKKRLCNKRDKSNSLIKCLYVSDWLNFISIFKSSFNFKGICNHILVKYFQSCLLCYQLLQL